MKTQVGLTLEWAPISCDVSCSAASEGLVSSSNWQVWSSGSPTCALVLQSLGSGLFFRTCQAGFPLQTMALVSARITHEENNVRPVSRTYIRCIGNTPEVMFPESGNTNELQHPALLLGQGGLAPSTWTRHLRRRLPVCTLISLLPT